MMAGYLILCRRRKRLQSSSSPETVVVIPDRGTGLHINFRAQIQGADPRDLTSKSKRIELFCTYDYRL